MAAARPKASVLFAPHELRLYLRWRSEQPVASPSDKFPPFPDAYEYAAFLTWRAKERTRILRKAHITDVPDNATVEQEDPIPDGCAVAQICGHALHPATTTSGSEDISHCPVCVYKLHAALIAAIWEKWLDLEGPWHGSDHADNAERTAYNNTNRAYHTAKVALVNAMQDIEDKAALEENWAEAHHVANAYGTVKALELYQTSIDFPTTSGVAPQTPLSTPAKRRLKEKKKIEYSPDTPENTRHRPQSLWSRTMSSHDPNSPHACPSDEGYWDTSYCNDWHFNVSQCRILLCSYPDEETLKLEYRDLNAGPDRGLEIPGVEHLITLLERHIAKQNARDQQWWYRYLRSTSDIFLVFREEGDEEMFSAFEKVEGLLGSHVEEYAREIGEIDDEEWGARKDAWTEQVGEDEELYEVDLASDRSDQAEFGGSEDEVEDIKLRDSMDLEEDSD
jgi:hypothetical protein